MAILRQKERVKGLTPTSDKKKYLFREINGNLATKKIIPITETMVNRTYHKFNTNVILSKICNQIPLSDFGAESGRYI